MDKVGWRWDFFKNLNADYPIPSKMLAGLPAGEKYTWWQLLTSHEGTEAETLQAQ
jgi:hypothetical protein